MAQPMITLNDGNQMPQLGTGIWQVAADETARVVTQALQTGYRLIDGAKAYGNEEGLGEAVRNSDIPRDQIFVTTKLWNDAQGYDAALRAFDASMQRLGLEDLDLYLIHWPMPAADLYVESWKALIRLREEGRVRSIGVANFHRPHLQRLIDETGITPALNQIELHPSLAQQDMRKANQELGIITQSWSPLGRGDLDLPEITEIARQHGKTPAQVVLNWHLQHGLSVIPKSSHQGRMADNFDSLNFTLTEQNIQSLDVLDRGNRVGPDPEIFDKN